MKKATSFIKSFILYIRPGAWLGFMSGPLIWLAYLVRLSQWIARNPVKGLNDFYSPFRDYSKRYQLYQYLVGREYLREVAINYVELGVSTGLSFKWWVANNVHTESRFYGFDTFEGLPEKWGNFEKGAMSAAIPIIEGARHEFIKGLFQDTLPGFILRGRLLEAKRNIIHFDADLFSSTLYGLTQLHPYLKPGDILMFDEFNVPSHEFRAFNAYVDSHYVKYEVLAAVNNYFQIAVKLI